MPMRSRRSVIRIALLLCRCATVRTGGGRRLAQSSHRSLCNLFVALAYHRPIEYSSPHLTQLSVSVSVMSYPFLFNRTHSRLTPAQPLPASISAMRTGSGFSLWTDVHNFFLSVLYRVSLSLDANAFNSAKLCSSTGFVCMVKAPC